MRNLFGLVSVTGLRFASVGAMNTIIDFSILNLLVFGAGIPRIPANLVSATVAMTFSFLANRRFVFKSNNRGRKQVIQFVLVTVTGLYVVQTIVIYGLTELWVWPLESLYDLISGLDIAQDISQNFVITNGAKVVATAMTMIWNFVLYQRLVFAKAETQPQEDLEQSEGN